MIDLIVLPVYFHKLYDVSIWSGYIKYITF